MNKFSSLQQSVASQPKSQKSRNRSPSPSRNANSQQKKSESFAYKVENLNNKQFNDIVKQKHQISVLSQINEKESQELAASYNKSNEKSRILKIGNHEISLPQEGKMLICESLDKPGILSSVSNILQKNNIQFSSEEARYSRKVQEKYKLSAVPIKSSNISETVVKQIANIPGIFNLKVINV